MPFRMDEDIRKYIALMEGLIPQTPLPLPVEFEPEVEVEEEPSLDDELLQKMEDLVFKLRSYQDPDIGEYSAGVESGMNRAADMMQNLLNRIRGI